MTRYWVLYRATHPVNCSVKPMINGPKSQRTFSIIIKLISFGRNHYQKSEKSHIFSLPGHRPESVHFESVCFILAPIREKTRRRVLPRDWIQTQFLSVPDTFSRYPNIYLKLSNSIFCSSVVAGRLGESAEAFPAPTFNTTFITHQRPETEAIKGTQEPQPALTFVCSAKFLTTLAAEKTYLGDWRLGKWLK